MTSTIWSIAILVFAIAGLFGFRNLSNRARFAFDLVCLVALSAVLYQRGGMSLFEPSVAASAASHIWLRAVIVVWWILSARIVVGLLYFTVRHDRRSREARLFFDLVAAAITLVMCLYDPSVVVIGTPCFSVSVSVTGVRSASDH
jgi:hypothetical protein